MLLLRLVILAASCPGLGSLGCRRLLLLALPFSPPLGCFGQLHCFQLLPPRLLLLLLPLLLVQLIYALQPHLLSSPGLSVHVELPTASASVTAHDVDHADRNILRDEFQFFLKHFRLQFRAGLEYSYCSGMAIQCRPLCKTLWSQGLARTRARLTSARRCARASSLYGSLIASSRAAVAGLWYNCSAMASPPMVHCTAARYALSTAPLAACASTQ
mmetsp:Transcript_1220/g.3606  ORF Transcript_1220/g.3606 Transcript_1220/m.3606 type:complete len:215 (+) Transcript_1220:388-1032(+)